ncbi:hypothetical protein PV797_05480 [Clostridiaceae bacterium M8S5]|nr:hypothetical protein PV797_05480 [Clostridiaceae bacterium M8S5]
MAMTSKSYTVKNRSISNFTILQVRGKGVLESLSIILEQSNLVSPREGVAAIGTPYPSTLRSGTIIIEIDNAVFFRGSVAELSKIFYGESNFAPNSSSSYKVGWHKMGKIFNSKLYIRIQDKMNIDYMGISYLLEV